jgi:pimeloyl-ACP methyl ester carboxylesterase
MGTSKGRLVLVACGAIPVAVVLLLRGGRNPSTSATSPAVSYQNAVAMIASRQASDIRIAIPEARSILLTHGAPTRRAFVLLHGLTDSPLQFAPLAQQLFVDGSNVFVPRFPRHGLPGGTARELETLTSAELRGFADSVVISALGLGDSVIVMGLSMGGATAAWIAQERSVTRAVLIAPALEAGRIPSLLDRPIVGLADRLPEVTWHARPDSGHPDRELGLSTRAVAAVLEVGGWVLRDAAHSAPATRQMVFLVNANDRTVRESAEEELAREWARHGAAAAVYELPDSLRLPHNVVAAPPDPVLAGEMRELLRELSYGERPSMLVRAIPVSAR